MEFIISYAHFLVLSLFHSNPSHQIYIGIVDSVVVGGIAWAAVSQITYSLRDQINSDDADFFLCGVKHIFTRRRASCRRVYFTSLPLCVFLLSLFLYASEFNPIAWAYCNSHTLDPIWFDGVNSFFMVTFSRCLFLFVFIVWFWVAIKTVEN